MGNRRIAWAWMGMDGHGTDGSITGVIAIVPSWVLFLLSVDPGLGGYILRGRIWTDTHLLSTDITDHSSLL
jgi:hypothetical protein